MSTIRLIDLNESNIESVGLFCLMSKPESAMYRAKVNWMKARLREGLRYKKIVSGGRGFIEYIPGKYAWRGIKASQYMVIHCLWVVGKAKDHGCGTALIQECLRDAKESDLAGVAAVSARKQLGLVETGFYLRQGFEVVDTAPPGLELVALKFGNTPDPCFLKDWKGKGLRIGSPLTVTYTAQCPCAGGLADNLADIARAQEIPLNTVQLISLGEMRQRAPSAYGTFAISCKGRVLTHLYHRMSGDRLVGMIRS